MLRSVRVGSFHRGACAAAATLVTVLVLGLSAAPANAWYAGHVWVNFGSWNCPGGGSVVGIYWANDYFSVGPAGGDWGDHVIYPRVRIGAGAHNTISYQLFCKKWGFYTYRAAVSQRNIYPSHWNQSFWF